MQLTIETAWHSLPACPGPLPSKYNTHVNIYWGQCAIHNNMNTLPKNTDIGIHADKLLDSTL